MDSMIWWVILGMGAVTQVIKLVLLTPATPPTLPQRWQAALRVAPACALLSIMALEALRWEAGWWFSWHNPKVLALLVASACFYITRKPMLTIAVGCLVLMGLRSLG
jgi:branched-subunit amino acid transport protein